MVCVGLTPEAHGWLLGARRAGRTRLPANVGSCFMAMATLVSDASASSVTRPGCAATVSQMNIAADSCTGCPCTGAPREGQMSWGALHAQNVSGPGDYGVSCQRSCTASKSHGHLLQGSLGCRRRCHTVELKPALGSTPRQITAAEFVDTIPPARNVDTEAYSLPRMASTRAHGGDFHLGGDLAGVAEAVGAVHEVRDLGLLDAAERRQAALRHRHLRFSNVSWKKLDICLFGFVKQTSFAIPCYLHEKCKAEFTLTLTLTLFTKI